MLSVLSHISRVLRFPFSSKKTFFALLVVIGIGGFFLFTQKPKVDSLQYAAVTRQDIVRSVSASGVVAGKDTANLRFRTGGKIAYLKVEVGDTVTPSQLIAGLDTQDLSITLQQARNTLTAKQATLYKIYDDVKGHESDETHTQKDLRTQAEVAANNAYDGVKAAERAFQDAVLYTPIGGVITQAPLFAGQFVSPSDLVVQIVDDSEIFFDADVDESELGSVKIGQSTEITLNAYPDQTFTGTVTKILPQTKVTSNGATVVTVRIALPPGVVRFVNGLSGQALITAQSSISTLTIPSEALVDDEYVYVQTPKGPEKRKVTVGIRSDTQVEIKDGINEKDNVIKNPSSIKRNSSGKAQ
jgi:RND family efflux transporter MFP subunit